MSSLKQISSAPVRSVLGNRCMSRPIVAIGTTKSAINTTAAAEFTIDGIIYNKAAMTSEALVATVAATHLPASQAAWLQPSGLSGFYTQPASTTVYYVLTLNAAGTMTVVQGTYDGQPIANGAGYAEGDGSVPALPEGVAPFGMVKVVTGATTFVPATTLFDAANVTATFYTLACLPAANP